MGSLHKNQVIAGVPQDSIFGPPFFLLCINDFSDVICDIAIYADDTTVYSNCDQVSDLWQKLELASELESDLRDIVDWGRKWHLIYETLWTGAGSGFLISMLENSTSFV